MKRMKRRRTSKGGYNENNGPINHNKSKSFGIGNNAMKKQAQENANRARNLKSNLNSEKALRTANVLHSQNFNNNE